MTTIRLNYTLSDAARRTELAAGRSAHTARSLLITPTPNLASICTLAPDGTATLERAGYRHDGLGSSWPHADAPLTTDEEAVMWLAAIDAADELARAADRERDVARERASLALIAETSARVLAMVPEQFVEVDGRLSRTVPEYRVDQLTEEATAHLEPLRRAVDELAAGRRAAHEAAEVERLRPMREWVEIHAGAAPYDRPEVARAAREGRDVRGALRLMISDEADALIAAALPAGCEQATVYEQRPREGVPSAEAYALLDALRAVALEVSELLPDAVCTVADVERFEVGPGTRKIWRTGCGLVLTHPWLSSPIEIPVLCEPLALDGDDQ